MKRILKLIVGGCVMMVALACMGLGYYIIGLPLAFLAGYVSFNKSRR